MNITKSILLVVVALVSFSFSQDGINITKFEGNTCITSSKKQETLLSESIAMINEMKRMKAKGEIDTTTYNKNVATAIKGAKRAGIKVINN